VSKVSISRREQTSFEPWHVDDHEPRAGELEIALQLESSDAQQWCRLGEYYDARACRATDPEMATQYRERAVGALTQAITLDPALAKAHFVLANVYRARDARLALLELEAAAKCDPQAYEEALEHAQKAVADCTYRLRDLNLIVLESAQEAPCTRILDADFYFDDCTVRSAALHTCVSQDQRQHAKLWLFESASPDKDSDRPVAQLTVSSTGNIYVSAGCPAGYDASRAQISRPPPDASSGVATCREANRNLETAGMAARPIAASPGPRRQRLPLWVPVGMLVLAFSSSLFAYLTLIAPAHNPVEKRANPPEATQARRVQTSSDEIARIGALPPMKQQAALPATPRRNTPVATAATPVAVGATAAAAPERKPAVRSAASEPGAALEVAAPQRASSSLPDATLTTAALKEPPVIVPLQKELPAPVQAAESDRSTDIRVVRSESRAAPSTAPDGSDATTDWLSRMRAELDVCGKPGMWRSDLCRESVRWKYCHPNRWEAALECAVERFASSSATPN
jgi:hypothetical protein